MELHILNSAERNHSNLSFPGWSKMGQRTRPGKALILIPAKENLPPKKRKKLKVDAKDDEIANPGPDVSTKSGMRARKQHMCEICDRSFRSYHPLGGHKAHHDNESRAADGEHECPFCYKMLSKGQALGGHKRHCQRRVANNHARILDFDLNELPPEWLDP